MPEIMTTFFSSIGDTLSEAMEVEVVQETPHTPHSEHSYSKVAFSPLAIAFTIVFQCGTIWATI